MPLAATAVTTIAASAPQFGLRPTDGWLVGAISEMKIDFRAMNKVAYLLNWGANIGAESSNGDRCRCVSWSAPARPIRCGPEGLPPAPTDRPGASCTS